MSSQSRPRLLLAAGLPELRNVLRHVLEDAAYDVTVTGNGIEAIGLVFACIPDVLVLELELQSLDGLVALEVLRAAGRHVPAVLLSPVVDAGVTRAAARLGICAVIRKPFRNAELLAAIARSLVEPERRGAPVPIPETPKHFTLTPDGTATIV